MTHAKRVLVAFLLLVGLLVPTIAAAAGFGPPPPGGGGGGGLGVQFQGVLSEDGVEIAKRAVLALLLFIGGWILAKGVSYGVFKGLSATQVDNKIARFLHLDMLFERKKGGREEENALERGIAQVIYYLIMLLVVVGVLQFAGLTQVATPIQGLVDTVVQALPVILGAAAILTFAWAAGRILSFLVTKALDKARVDKRFAELAQTELADKGEHAPFSQTAGRVIYWLVILLGVAGAFEILQIEPLADPMRNAINRVVSLLPSVAIGVVLVMAGWVAGRIARVFVRSMLQGLGFDALLGRFGLDKLTGKHPPSDVIGIVLMVFIMVQAGIAALNEVGLETLSGPLTEMVSQFWELLPALAISALFVAAGVILGGLLRRVVAAALKNLGFDRLMERLGFRKLTERDDRLGEYSELLGFIAQVAVVLVATAQALDNLDLGTWSGYLNAFLDYSITHVVVALLIVMVGFAIGNYVRDLIHARKEDPHEVLPRWFAEFARYTVLVFAFTMAVHHLDVAEDFVLISFALLFGSLCLALALAFGLGAREVAGEVIRRRYDRARGGGGGVKPPTVPPAAPKTPPG